MTRAEKLAIDFARELVKKATYLPIERIEPGGQRDFLLSCTASLANAFLAGYRAGCLEAAKVVELEEQASRDMGWISCAQAIGNNIRALAEEGGKCSTK